MLSRILLVVFLLLGCGQHRSPSQHTTSPKEALQAQYTLYHSRAPRGWDAAQGCDSLLFVSLQQVGLDRSATIEIARNDVGQWFRFPDLKDDSSLCSSDISRDMFMGLFSYMLHFHRLDLAEDLWNYGVDHAWKMGEERLEPNTRTVFTPATISLLAGIIHALGGQDHPERFLPTVYNTEPGYVSHLTLLQIWLQGQLHDGLTDEELDTLRTIRGHMNLNPLVHALIHKYTDGNQTEATRLLLNIWPQNRLPTTADWSEEWRLQRSDTDPGLLPGMGDAPHSGGDLLFPAAIVLEVI